jgi:hypothetical protein
MGARVVELGSGPGVLGIMLAKLGAQVRRAACLAARRRCSTLARQSAGLAWLSAVLCSAAHRDQRFPSRLAAQVVVTDKGVVVPLMQENIAANGLPDRP